MDEAWLQAVRDAIRTANGLDEYGCEVTPDGRAIPAAGEWFYAVHPNGLANKGVDYLDETASLFVTVTMRTGVAPQDRVGPEKLLPAGGLIRRAKELRALISMNYEIMNAANALIAGTVGYVAAHGGTATVASYDIPLRFTGAQYLGPKGPDWFWAEGQDDACTGLAVQLAFGGARRVQYIQSQT